MKYNNAMRHFFTYSLIGLSLLGVSLSANAQMAYNTAGGVTTGKQVTGPNKDGSYTITLEAYAEGESSVSTKTTDIVLVLDISGSMTEPVGSTTQLGATSLNYDTVKNGEVEYFLQLNEGGTNYWEKIYAEQDNGRYYLYVWPRNKTYLTSYGTSTYRSQAAYATSPTANIVTNRTGLRSGASKIQSLENSVKFFLQEINKSDKFQADGTTPRKKRLGNRVAIVTFSSNSDTAAGWTLLGNSALETGNDDGYDALVLATETALANPQGGTNVHYGMSAANSLLSNSSAGNKTVVLFTDGIPGENGRWNQAGYSSANSAINNANSIKGSDGKNATVWAVGAFSNMNTSDKQNTDTYMNRVSSNYYNVTSMTSSATAADDQKYYIEVADEQQLLDVFKDIASEQTDHETVDESTQVKDVISSSFTLPDDAEPTDIKIHTMDFKSDASGWENEQTPAGVTAVITEMQKLDENDQPVYDEEGEPVMLKTVQVQGFDFSKDDSAPGQGDGNWVGPRKVQGVTTYAGKKLVISFNIVQVNDVTGGAGTNTNTSQSGVYVMQSDGTYKNINEFKVPHTTLPINLKITKTGLRHGESATFEIERCRPKNWDETKTLEQNLAAMEYNGLGKPIPSKGDDEEWENWTKVIITNKGANGEAVVKTLVALDPYYVYKIEEDTWSWAYDAVATSGQNKENTSTVEVNPFKFKNQARTGEDIPKHAEAVTINHFNFTISGGEFSGKQEEHYKSSKDQFQTNPTTE